MRRVVTDIDTAAALGSGEVEVLGTPRLIAWLEAETVRVAADRLDPGQTSVGTAITVRHRRPTPVGDAVEVSAILRAPVEGHRLVFEVSAVDATGALVADGTIERAIVDRASFGHRASAPVPERPQRKERL